ncbi:DUF2637 domain-containing protein [Streptomyces sp. NPDC127108]|uniref:DUF2637 domain-containing protein n=1 Tax=Streptomyces sp. NPDC127108 TaxID=3345361 RepID=UPI003637B180
MQRVTPDDWDWTAPILPLVVDVAVIIVIRLDAAVSRLGGTTGGWPAVLRWMTGLFTLLLNVGDSALSNDPVGVAVHAVAPLLLIVTAEASLSYRRKITVQLERLERSRRAEEERSRAAAQARREQERAEREHERERREQADREAREHAERLEQERAQREREERREEREHAAQLERERADRETLQRREEREAAEQARREERQRIDREQAERLKREQQERDRAEREQAEREAHKAAVREQQEREQREARERLAARREQSAVNNGERPALTAVPVNSDHAVKMPEGDARTYVGSFLDGEKTVRELADETGWSVGWVSARLREQRGGSLVPALEGTTS